VHDGIIYMFVPGASVQAVDGTNGDLIWEYQRDYPQSVAAATRAQQEIGIYEDMLYLAARTACWSRSMQDRKVRWETKVDKVARRGRMLVADGKVITSRTCPQGVREFCFIVAHDAKTGKELWKFYSTAAPGEPGGDTWADMPVDSGGRTLGPAGLL